MEHEVSGLARDIRAIVTSDQFDLGGYTETRARDLIIQSFAKPLTAPSEMIKITFVVGGGKLVRSRYAEDLPKWIMAALRDIGFQEDRSAAETFDSQGTFKHQHDIGQNLKYVIVYPHVTCATKGKASSEDSGDTLLDENSPEYLVLASELPTFQEMVGSKVVSYTQKKKLLKFLQQQSESFKSVEAKLMTGAKLTTAEQFIYGNVSDNHEQKLAWLQNQIKEMVDQGQITAREKADLLHHIEANLQSIQQEIETAKAENKPKKVEKLEAKREASSHRKQFVEKLSPLPPRLPRGEEIRKIYFRLFPLLAIEDKSRSMSLTMQDLKLLEEKPDLEREISRLQQESRGWFEEDSSQFQERCEFEEKEAKRVYQHRQSEKKAHKKPSASASTSKSAVSSGWSTVARKPGSAAPGHHSTTKKTSSSAFAAAFDDDSDD